MRRFVIILAVTATLAAGSIGRTAPGTLPATCGNTAPSGLHACNATFTLTEPMAVNMRLTPAVGYTGSLKAWLKKGTAPINGSAVGAYFVAGQVTPLANLYPQVDALFLTSGTYTLVVESGKLLQACAAPWACAPLPAADTFAVGAWSAEVVETDAVV